MTETKRGKRNLDLFCGYILSDKEQEFLIRSTLVEFELPVKLRKTPLELVNEARQVVRHLNKWKKLM
jgi:hypothetical protein